MMELHGKRRYLMGINLQDMLWAHILFIMRVHLYSATMSNLIVSQFLNLFDLIIIYFANFPFRMC